jgi:hypothetical protein
MIRPADFSRFSFGAAVIKQAVPGHHNTGRAPL